MKDQFITCVMSQRFKAVFFETDSRCPSFSLRFVMRHLIVFKFLAFPRLSDLQR
jgi:hypothetical protein